MSNIIKANISDLTPDPRNANKGTQRGRGMLDKSLRQYGAGRSILLDKHNRIIAGNKTTEAAADIGLNDVMIVESDGTQLVAVKRTDLDLDDNAARELAYADNRVAQVDLDWDATQMLQDAAAGVDLDKFFLKDELDEMLGRAMAGNADAEPQIDRAAELNEKWQVKTGDLWRIGEHRLLCGDSIKWEDVERVMQGERAQAVVTDVPYEISQESNGLRRLDYGEWDGKGATDVAIAAIGLCDQIPTITAFCGDEQLSILLGLWKDRTKRTVVWVKPNPTVINGDHVLLPACELAAHGRIDGAWFGGKCVRSVWEGTSPREREHPNQKPVELIAWLIGLTCELGKNVYEPFAGSGTTLVACQNLQRKCRAIEISPNYCAVILQRMQDAFPQIEIERL